MDDLYDEVNDTRKANYEKQMDGLKQNILSKVGSNTYQSKEIFNPKYNEFGTGLGDKLKLVKNVRDLPSKMTK